MSNLTTDIKNAMALKKAEIEILGIKKIFKSEQFEIQQVFYEESGLKYYQRLAVICELRGK